MNDIHLVTFRQRFPMHWKVSHVHAYRLMSNAVLARDQWRKLSVNHRAEISTLTIQDPTEVQ